MKILSSIKTFLIVCIFGLYSCNEDFFSTTLTIDPPPHEESLVVTAYGNTRTNTLEASVSKSVGLLEDVGENSTLINNANVKLIVDNIEYQLENDPSGNFEFNYFLPNGLIQFEEGKTYELKVNAPNFNEVSALAEVPMTVIPKSIELDKTETSIGDGYEYFPIDIVFDDPGDEDNYYESGALISLEYYGQSGFDYTYVEFIDPIIEYGISNMIFKDDSFNGLEKSITYYLPLWTIEENPGIEDFLYMNWRTISFDQFRYSRSVEQQLVNGDNPFSTPTQVFTNVENGLGIFAISNENFIQIN